jgi:nicotinamide mononucleotide adenylyltransferase
VRPRQASQWLLADPWEVFQSYQRTAVVLDHFDYEINTVLGGTQVRSLDKKRRIRVVRLAGSDLISTISEPGVWSEEDVSDIPPYALHLQSLSFSHARL